MDLDRKSDWKCVLDCHYRRANVSKAAFQRCSYDMFWEYLIYRRTPMLKCDFNKVALKLYWSRTLAWCSSVDFLHIFRTRFYKNTSVGLLLNVCSWILSSWPIIDLKIPKLWFWKSHVSLTFYFFWLIHQIQLLR